ncbi:HNH endonuclease [Erysipelotrichaceae bacterium OttesenSCG-928-M19]|nr:HNH endonuclease [Erysipelotrichaceae bacterium OttesenSCG-928-M19]
MRYKKFKDKQNKLYHSSRWKKIRLIVISNYNFKCCRCGKITKEKDLIVHHIVYLNKDNIDDDEIAYGLDNLEPVCINCHNKEHFKKKKKREIEFDAEGNIINVIDND